MNDVTPIREGDLSETAEIVKAWRIQVPSCWNTGEMIPLAYHQEWDAKVRAIAGGMTVFVPAKGSWLSPHGPEYKEPVIPVEVACTEKQMHLIRQMTMGHYWDQEAIYDLLISEQVTITYRE